VPTARITSKLVKLSLLLFLGLLPLASAHADPIVLSGSARVFNFSPNVRATVNVNGSNATTTFAANVTARPGLFGLRVCSESTAGMTNGCTSAGLGWTSSGTDISGTVTVNGMNFSADVINQLSLNFSGFTFTIPPELLSANAFRITAPFTFTGMFSSPSLSEALDLTGQGTVTVFLSRRTVGMFPGIYLDEAIYQFGPTVEGITVEAVPEPATMVLLLSGLAGTALRVRKRRAQ
jgi:PEP-CTERM motif-containing protein